MPTEIEVLEALKRHGQNCDISNRTLNRVNKGKPDFCSQLCQRVLEELRKYNEDEIEIKAQDTSEKRGQIPHLLRYRFDS